MLLGVDGVCVISHGSSSARAILNAVRVAHEAATGDLGRIVARGGRQDLSVARRRIRAEPMAPLRRHVANARSCSAGLNIVRNQDEGAQVAETTGAIMSRGEVLELVRSQLAEILEIDISEIGESSSFADDLNADSLALDRARRGARGGAERPTAGLPYRRRGSRGSSYRARRRRLCEREGRGGLNNPTGEPQPYGRATEPSASRLSRLTGTCCIRRCRTAPIAPSGAVRPSNERLELLGDAVLGLVVADHLYRAFPDLAEGDLARLRAAVVSTEALAPVATELGVGEAVLLGKGEETSGGRAKDSILADCLEAIIAAVYLSLGLAAATRFVVGLLEDPIEVIAEGRLGDPKNWLQELTAQLDLDFPAYTLTDKGPDHAKVFFAEVSVGGEVLGRGTGTSKKIAERAAAAAALAVIESRQGDGPAR